MTQERAEMASTQEPTGREMTYGEKAVGLTFNPSGDPDVYSTKRMYADLINLLDALKKEAKSGEHARLYSIAITQAQQAQMWAVKAITWKD